jgi:hypothetical protein
MIELMMLLMVLVPGAGGRIICGTLEALLVASVL